LPRAFGLKAAAPLWTIPALDRCLVLALVYPIAAIFLFWAISGHVGPAEAALILPADFPGFGRALSIVSIGLQVFAMWRFARTKGWKSFAWAAIAFLLAITLAFAVSVAAASAIVVALGAIFGVVVSLVGALTLAIASILTFTLATALAVPDLTAITVAFAVAVGFAAAMLGNRMIPLDHPRKGLFLFLLLPVLILFCLGAAKFISPLRVWEFVGPLLLFGGYRPYHERQIDKASRT
jgi:hypothetical protein